MYVDDVIGTNKIFKNDSFFKSINKNKRPREKISEAAVLTSKHSGLAKIGVPPLVWPTKPKSVKTISIRVKSFGPFKYLTK